MNTGMFGEMKEDAEKKAMQIFTYIATEKITMRYHKDYLADFLLDRLLKYAQKKRGSFFWKTTRSGSL